jgi:hypothetical protein
MDYIGLKAELDDGHPDTGVYNIDHALAAAELNNKNRTKIVRVLVNEIQRYMFEEGVYIALVDESIEGSGASQIASRTALTLFESKMTDVNVLAENSISGLSVLVTANVLTQAQSDTIIDKASVSISRAEEIGLGKVKPGHVEKVRNG